MSTTTDVNLNGLISELQRYREEEPELSDSLRVCINEFEHLKARGWPDSEIVYNDNDKPGGIPIEFARMVLELCQYCADHNIDLADAIARVRN